MATISGNYKQTAPYSMVTISGMPRRCSVNSPTSTTTVVNEDRDSVTGSWSRSSSTTPGFNDPNREGRLKPLPFTFTSNKSRRAVGSWDTKYITGCDKTNRQERGCFGTSMATDTFFPSTAPGIDTAVLDRVRDIATNKLLGKIKSGTMNMGVTMAERGKTADTVGSAAGRLGRAMGHLRRGNIGRAAEEVGGVAGRRQTSRFNRQYARDAEKAVASGWLELQYGWKPILNDVYGACEALARRNLNDKFITTTHREWFEQPFDESKITSTANSGKLINRAWVTGKRKTEVKISCTYYRPSTGIKSLSEVGITNPGLVAWELVPYSFVVDWFLPIGAWLDTFDATLGLTFYSGYRTEFIYRTYTMTQTQNGLDQYGAQQEMYKTGGNDYVSCRRVVLSDFPSPAIPRFKTPTGLSTLASGMALLHNFFRK